MNFYCDSNTQIRLFEYLVHNMKSSFSLTPAFLRFHTGGSEPSQPPSTNQLPSGPTPPPAGSSTPGRPPALPRILPPPTGPSSPGGQVINPAKIVNGQHLLQLYSR